MAGMRVVTKDVPASSAPSMVRSRSPGPGGGAGTAPGLTVPRMSRSVIETRSTLPSRRSARNRLIGISTGRGATSQPWTAKRSVSPMKR